MDASDANFFEFSLPNLQQANIQMMMELVEHQWPITLIRGDRWKNWSSGFTSETTNLLTLATSCYTDRRPEEDRVTEV